MGGPGRELGAFVDADEPERTVVSRLVAGVPGRASEGGLDDGAGRTLAAAFGVGGPERAPARGLGVGRSERASVAGLSAGSLGRAAESDLGAGGAE